MTFTSKLKLTPERAKMLCEALELDWILNDEEEVKALADLNPELLNAYRALYGFASKED